MPKNKLKYRPIVLLILDGWGVATDSPGNAIFRAKTPNLSKYISMYPTTTLISSGDAVGLGWGEMGNSEVGHLNIGAGLVFYQNLPRISKEIKEGLFYENEVLLQAAEQVKKKKSKFHLMGLVSNGGVHSHIDHLFALMEFCKKQKIKDVYLHAMTDGRDAIFNSGKIFMKDVEEKAKELKVNLIVCSLSGRYFAMDRDNRWERTSEAYDAIFNGKAKNMTSDSAIDYLEKQYKKKIYDEKMEPVVFTKNRKPLGIVEDGDALIFFNFRSDRARQLTQAIAIPDFNKITDKKEFKDLYFATMVEYEENIPVEIIYPPIRITEPLAKVFSDYGYKQLHVAETEKYAHVTFFLNGGEEEAFEGEERKVIPSPKVSTYDQKPEMRAKEITDELVRGLEAETYDFYVANYANADMVAHTGDLKATIKGCETVDKQISRVVEAALAKNGLVIITADHGNAEELLNLQTNKIDKEHSTNPVPFIAIAHDLEGKNMGLPEGVGNDLSLIQPTGILADVAPTILKLAGLKIPKEMTGSSLI